MKQITSALNPGEGFDGVLYPVRQASGRPRTDKVVITLPGSEGGLQNAERMARFLHQHQIPALALGYYRTAHTGRDLARIPLEYIEHAIRWLKENGYEKIAVQGISRGAEYAAAAAVTFPEITCTILRAPGCFYSEGLIRNNPSGTSSWIFRGEELPYAPFSVRSFTGQRQRELAAASEPGSTAGEQAAADGRAAGGKTPLLAAEPAPAAAIPLERAHGPVLIFSSEADTVLPSAENGRTLDARLSSHGFPHPHRHVCYNCVSHILLEQASRFSREVFQSERAHPEECARERQHLGDTTIHWIENIWK